MVQKSTAFLISIGFCLLVSAPSQGVEKRGSQHGIYDSVPLKEKEVVLLKTAHDYEELMQRRGLLYVDPELQSWLSGIGHRLIPDPSDDYQQYRFYLFRDPSPNAFALPDGQIYVHTGMLARLQNEAQLAALLAHEINHVAGHHSVVSFRSREKKAVFSVLLNVAANVTSNLALGVILLTDSVLAASIYGYSRSLEKEADTRAYDLMLNAGYDVREIPGLYEVLGHDYEGLQPRIIGKWSTHPALKIRAKYMADLVAKTPADVLSRLYIGDAGFRKRVRPVALKVVDDYILDNYPKTALAFARTLVDEDPSDPDALVAVGNACIALAMQAAYSTDQVINNKKMKKAVGKPARLTQAELRAQANAMTTIEKNSAAAEQAFLATLELDAYRAGAYRGLGWAYLHQKRYKESAAAFMKYLKMKPVASDRPIIIDQLHKIMAKIKSG